MKVAVIEQTALVKVVTESGLAIEEGEKIKQSYQPFLNQLAEIQEQTKKIDFENPTEIDEKIARELRLKTVKVRTGSENLKDERKRGYMLHANLEQASWNLIAASCKLTEEALNNVEKARELAERKRKESLKIERAEILTPYVQDVSIFPLGEMSETDFNSLHLGMKAQYEAKIEAEKKAEQAAIEKARIDELRNTRKDMLLPMWQHVPENFKGENFGEFTDDQWSQFLNDVVYIKDQYEAKQEEVRKENERLQAEVKAKEAEALRIQKENEAKLLAERKLAEVEAEKQRKIADAKAAEEKRISDEKIKAETEAREKAEQAAKLLRDAENERIEAEKAEQKAKALEAKRLAKAPEKDKLQRLVNSIKVTEDFSAYQTKLSPEADAICREIIAKFAAFKGWANEQIETL